MKSHYLVAAALLSLVVTAAFAASSYGAYCGGDIAYTEQVFNGIPYLSGGIGLDERNAMRGIENNYNTKLVFAMNSGEYLADIRVMVQDQKGNTLLDKVSEGPWFLMKLPAGAYKVSASFGDTMRAAHVSVGRGTDRQVFYW